MRVGLSMPAAHIPVVTTTNNADNRSRQPEGAPNSTGGQFANEPPKPDAAAGAIAVTPVNESLVARVRAAHQLAERLADQVIEQQQKLAVTMAKIEILGVWPTATTAILWRSYEKDDEAFHVERVLDADGTVLFDRFGQVGQEAFPANAYLEQVDDVDYTDYEYDEEHYVELEAGGAVTSLDLTEIEKTVPDAGDIVGVASLDTRVQYRLLNAAADQVGQVIIPASKIDFDMYLDEFPDNLGIPADTGAKLDAKYGGRAATLTALVGTDAFLDFESGAPDMVTPAIRRAIRDAIDEAIG